MSTLSASDFYGNYHVSQGSVYDPNDKEDPRRLVVFGNLAAIWPFKDQSGCSLLIYLDPEGKEQALNLDLKFDPDQGVMIFKDSNFNNTGQPLTLQISLYTDGSYKTIYSVMTYGDPENVGVWGADDGQG